eukprot:9044670-Alexandrium_andersonii.AAC.1
MLAPASVLRTCCMACGLAGVSEFVRAQTDCRCCVLWLLAFPAASCGFLRFPVASCAVLRSWEG